MCDFVLLCVSRRVYIVSLPVEEVSGRDQAEGGYEEEEEEADRQSRFDSSHSNKQMLLVYRIMFYPMFDCYLFPSQSKSGVVNALSRPTLDDRVSNTLQAR